LVDLSTILENGDEHTPFGAKAISPSSGHVTFDILANGEISIVGQNIVKAVDAINRGTDNPHHESQREVDIKMEDATLALEKLHTLARSLDISGDLDMWIAWMSLWPARSG
jgi:hypothetical protein